jgi:hypothetical protein
MRESAEARKKPLALRNSEAKLSRFLNKSNRGKYAALARLAV